MKERNYTAADLRRYVELFSSHKSRTSDEDQEIHRMAYGVMAWAFTDGDELDPKAIILALADALDEIEALRKAGKEMLEALEENQFAGGGANTDPESEGFPWHCPECCARQDDPHEDGCSIASALAAAERVGLSR